MLISRYRRIRTTSGPAAPRLLPRRQSALDVGGQFLEHRMVQGPGEPDQGVRGGAPALEPERAVALLADPHLVTVLQAEPVPEVGRENESATVIKSGIPTVAAHVGKPSTHPRLGSNGSQAQKVRDKRLQDVLVPR